MNFECTKKFKKQVLAIRDQSLLIEIEKTIENIKKSITINEIVNIKKMKGFSNAYRIKVKDYRICFYLNEDVVDIEKIEHRKDVYNDFP